MDLDPVLGSIWDYLLSHDYYDVMDLPLEFDCVDDLNISTGAKNLLGFWIARGRSTPAKSRSAWCRSGDYLTSFWSEDKRDRIAEQIAHITHWTSRMGDYRSIENVEATWFIDPPYQSKGVHYKYNQIDYVELADWAQTRKGQVIVCEQHPASWLPFEEFKVLRGVKDGGKKYSTEVVWYGGT